MLPNKNSQKLKITLRVAIFISLSGCAHRRAEQIRKQAHVQEARVNDLAMPLGARMTERSSATNFGYSTDLSRVDLVTFLLRDMERAGWRTSAQEDEPGTIVFEKPNALCVMKINPTPRECRVEVVRVNRTV